MPRKSVELAFIGENHDVIAQRCGICKQLVPLTDYHLNAKSKTGFHYICKKCNNRKALEYQQTHKDKRRNNTLSTRYGITSEQYSKMYIAQEGRCLICNETAERLVIDHCHTTGKVRALLCDRCNRGMGSFGDDLTLMQKAINYLLKFQELNKE